MDLAFALNDVEAKKQYELAERVTAYMYALNTYFHQGYERFVEMQTYLQSTSILVQKTRSELESERVLMLQRKRNLEQVNKRVTRMINDSQSKREWLQWHWPKLHLAQRTIKAICSNDQRACERIGNDASLLSRMAF